MHRRQFGFIVTITLLLAALSYSSASASPAAKGKPPKSPTATPTPGGGGGPDGTVYLERTDTIVKADASGGSQTVLTGFDANGSRHLATRAQHDGQAWFVINAYVDPTPVYPDGHPIRDLYAYDEAANAVALTALDASMQSLGGYNWAYDAARSLEDGVVLFTGREFDGSGNVTQGGIYQVQVAFDGSGAITGAVAGSLTLVAPAPLVTDGSRGLVPDAGYLSANGDGTQVLYSRVSDSTIMRTAFPTTSSSHTSLGIVGLDAEWSPTEDLIVYSAYDNGRNLYSATSSGGNVTKIVDGQARRGNKPGVANWAPRFAPDGAHLLFRRSYDPPVGNPTEALRAAKDGSGEVTLAEAISPAGWTVP
jgi:hypothetical protein